MRIIFFGSSEYCLPVLSCIKENFKLAAVVTKLDTEVKYFADQSNISVFTPRSKEELLYLRSDLEKLNVDLGIVADYGMIIPKVIFEIPKFKTINVHFSRLPKYRGASPVQYTILFGEKYAYITIIKMAEKMDTGEIIWQKEVKLAGNETTEDLYRRLFNIASQQLPDVIKLYAENKFKLQKQDKSQASYTKLLTRDDGYVPWEILIKAIKGMTKKPLLNGSIVKLLKGYNFLFGVLKRSNNIAFMIERMIRAFNPWPGVWTEIKIKNQNAKSKINVKRLKILKAHIEHRTKNLELRTKLVVDTVQLEGKKAVSWKQILDGYPNVKTLLK